MKIRNYEDWMDDEPVHRKAKSAKKAGPKKMKEDERPKDRRKEKQKKWKPQ